MKKNLLVLLLVFSVSAFCQDKIGYVNMEQVFSNYYKTYNANIVFEEKKLEFEEKMFVLAQGLEKDEEELKGLEANAKNELLSQEAREEAIRKFRVHLDLFNGKRNDFMRARQEGGNELTDMKGDTEDMLTKDLRDFIQKYAENNGYTHILDISGNTMNRMPMLLVFPKQQEITNDIIAKINLGHEKEIEEAKNKIASIEAKRKAAIKK